jgi:4-hydroxymandelate oxidase
MDMAELERDARERLDPVAWDYFEGGADDEITVAENVAAWNRIRLRPHVLRDVSTVDTGTPVASPVLVAPTAYQRLAHDDGEKATAAGAARAGTLMIVSTLATVALEDVAAAAPQAPRWFQLYVRRDRGHTKDLVARAVAAGYRALVLTADLPVLGFRRRDERNRFTLPQGMELANFRVPVPEAEGSAIADFADNELDPGVTLADLEWLQGLSDLPILVKGVLRGDDAAASVGAGASGVIVSNHGGRQLDTAVTGIEALPDVVEAVDGRAEVFVDGGVRRGTDVVKALAYGARAVLVGRPVLWGLAVGGAEGVTAVLDGLTQEVARAFALCGVRSVHEVDADLVASGGWR